MSNNKQKKKKEADMTDIDYAIETLKNLKEEPTLNARAYIHEHLDIAIKYLEKYKSLLLTDTSEIQKYPDFYD